MTKIQDKLPDYQEVLKEEFASRLIEAMHKKNYISSRNPKEVNGKKLAKNMGISFTMVRRYLTGQSLPENKKIKQLSELLNVDPWWLLYGNKHPKNSIKFKENLLIKIFEKMHPLFKKQSKNKESFNLLIKDAMEIYSNTLQINNKNNTQDKAIDIMVEFLKRNIQ